VLSCIVHKGIAHSTCCKASLLLQFSAQFVSCRLLIWVRVAWRYGRFNPVLSLSPCIVLIVLSMDLETGLPGIWGSGRLTPALSVVMCLQSSIVLLALLKHASLLCLSLWRPGKSVSCSDPCPGPWSSMASKVGIEQLMCSP
jgi:hypothetical protein